MSKTRENIIRLANDFILKYKIDALPLHIDDFQKLCDTLGYDLLSFSGAAALAKAMNLEKCFERPAFLICRSNCHAVCFDERQSVGTRLFALAHEIGHIALKHEIPASGTLCCSDTDTVTEAEANTSGEASRRQLKKAIERVESAMLLAFDISLSPDRIWQLNVAKAALDAAELLKPQEDRVKNAETIILSLFYNSVSEAPLLFPDAPQNSMPRLSAQSSAQSSKPFKTIAIILAVVACLVGICAAISSKDRGTDAPATTESTTQARAVRQAESTTNSTTIATTKHSASSVDIDYDETVYVETASKRFHKAFCVVKSNSKEMIAKMTRREAVKNKNNPCSACFHD